MSDSASFPVALITGASQRIGRAIAESLHQHNYRVLVHYHHNEQKACALTAQLNQIRPGSARSIQADLNSPADIQELASQAAGAWNRLDLLINNASIFTADESTLDDMLNLFQQSIDVNVRAALLLSRELQSALKKNQGSIINLIDIYSERPLRSHCIYSVSKAGMEMLTKSLALEMAPEIRVNGISPGAILWPSIEPDEQHQQQLMAKIPLERLGSTADIVSTIHYLRQCDYITGQIIKVDGGRSIVI